MNHYPLRSTCACSEWIPRSRPSQAFKDSMVQNLKSIPGWFTRHLIFILHFTSSPQFSPESPYTGSFNKLRSLESQGRIWDAVKSFKNSSDPWFGWYISHECVTSNKSVLNQASRRGFEWEASFVRAHWVMWICHPRLSRGCGVTPPSYTRHHKEQITTLDINPEYKGCSSAQWPLSMAYRPGMPNTIIDKTFQL